MPCERMASMRFLQSRVSKKATPQASSGVTAPWRTSGGGAAGKGWVGDGYSPGTASCGTAFSMMGNTGSPLARSKVNNRPALVAWMTASMARPSRRIVASVGCDARS